MRKLDPYQMLGAELICSTPAVGVALKMGAGKTVITLTAISALLTLGEVRRVLIVVPKKVMETRGWQRTISEWDHLSDLWIAVAYGSEEDRESTIRSGAPLVLITQEYLVWVIKRYGGRRDWPFDMVVLDDVKGIRDQEGLRFRAVKKLRWSARAKQLRPVPPRLVLLSGTFGANGVEQLWAPSYLIDEGQRLGRTLTAYREAYLEPESVNRRTGDVYRWRARPGLQEKVFADISDVFFTMDVDIGVDVVPRARYVQLPAAAMRAYRQMERDEVWGTVVAANAGVKTGKMLQMASGAVYDEQGNSVWLHDAKLDELSAVIDELNGEPLIVAYWYQHELTRLRERFPEGRVFDAALVDDWNAGKVPLLFIQPASAGHGVDGLQRGGETICWFCVLSDLDLYKQMNARLARRGAKSGTVLVIHLIAEATADERAMEVLEDRDATQEQLTAAILRTVP